MDCIRICMDSSEVAFIVDINSLHDLAKHKAWQLW